MFEIDTLDLKILTEVADDAKRGYADIGRRLNTHPNVISYRLNRLRRAGVIRNFTVNLDLEKIGLTEQLILGVNFPPGADREHVLSRILSIPQIIYAISSLGNPEGLIFLASKSKPDLDTLISRLKSLDVRIEYIGPVIKVYQEGQIENLLRHLASQTPGDDEEAERLEGLTPSIETGSR
ncbi:MAG: Lrp/AsnC family transcriptional regulator [Candidatus Bathyarchaeia archaeon]